jgi:predicted GIY-YIG superfamily endonuclease
MNGGIYQIRNIVNDKKYIGSTVNFTKRWARHKMMLRSKRKVKTFGNRGDKSKDEFISHGNEV